MLMYIIFHWVSHWSEVGTGWVEVGKGDVKLPDDHEIKIEWKFISRDCRSISEYLSKCVSGCPSHTVCLWQAFRVCWKIPLHLPTGRHCTMAYCCCCLDMYSLSGFCEGCRQGQGCGHCLCLSLTCSPGCFVFAWFRIQAVINIAQVQLYWKGEIVDLCFRWREKPGTE